MFNKTFSALVVCSVLASGAAFAADPASSSSSSATTTTSSSATTPAIQVQTPKSVTGQVASDAKVVKTAAKTTATKEHHKVVHKQQELTGSTATKGVTAPAADAAMKSN
ncbi:hypothetical protein [Telmatospirillum sp.]|uniref:hypothetical protein n=1 Tax=Telmatospirillum sp. TaxID=2079197 RepID=UPI00283D5A2A|nr:hypothetical protein [Telmatospirillum sp.]MDR3439093.1 hypothetical protein [Telmatospirillum sp.]